MDDMDRRVGPISCFPSCQFTRTQVSSLIILPCGNGQRFAGSGGVELIFNINLPDGRQSSKFNLQAPSGYPPEIYHFERRIIGTSFNQQLLDVKFYDQNSDFHVTACLTPEASNVQTCFMNQIISKRDAYEVHCGNIRDPGGVSFLFMSALLVFVCLLIGMAATVIIYRLYRRFRDRRPAREFRPIICDSSKLSTTSPPRPFHAQLTVVMEEEEDRCSPSTPIKDLLWRSSSPTPVNTPKGTISMQRNSPILSSLLPSKKPTPKPTNV